MITKRKLALFAFVVGVCRFAGAQATPPFFGPGVAYNPEVSVIPSGAVLDAQATVSADRKYVTINTRATESRVKVISRFPVVQTNQGFVGGVMMSAEIPGGVSAVAEAAPGGGPLQKTSPDQLSRVAKAWVFTRPGMYRLN